MGKNIFQTWMMFALATAAVTSISCTPPLDPQMDMLDNQLSEARIDSLSRAMNLVANPDRYQLDQFQEKLTSSLQRWANAQQEREGKQNWKVDPMADAFVKRLGEHWMPGNLNEFQFVNTDPYAIQQRFWAKKLAERLVASRELGPFEIFCAAAGLEPAPVESESETDDSVAPLVDDGPDRLAECFQKLHGLSAPESERLAQVVRIFDWVIRNVHLLADDTYTAERGDLDELKLKESDDLADAGVPGLGYTRGDYQTLLFSRGDYVERAKLFMTMLEQLEIDSVMLVPRTDEGSSRPWAVGVHVDKDLYLFDTRLGLPIPGKELGTIATLKSVKDNPEILKSLDLTVDESLKENTRYWVTAEQLTEIDALILAGPESLSYRFWYLENKLVGDFRTRLFVEPSKVRDRLPQMGGVKIDLWDIEFKTHRFRRTLRDAIAEASYKDDVRDKIRWYFADELYVYDFVRYRTARSKYFHGLFETIRDDRILNAIELFYSMIYKDSKIDSLATDGTFQYQLSINKGSQSAEEFERTIAGVQANMRLVRRDSGYFLAQCHFDNGNYNTATNWLTRLEAIEDTARWQPAINYLRARSLEAQRDYEPAIEIYRRQQSAQFHGDLIRTRLLKMTAAKVF